MEGSILTLLGSVFTEMLTWIGEVVTALTTSSGSLYGLLPLFFIGIGVSVFLVTVRAIRSLTWGA